MAAPANAYQRKDITHEAEDVRDIIYDVSPEETPFISNCAASTADNTKHQWHEDVLDAPADPGTADGNSWVDGDTFAGQAITPPARLDNECQIQRKDFIVTRRARRLNKYGQRDELARQVVRKGRELKRDEETVALYPQAKRADDGAVAPLLAGLPCWIAEAQGAGRADRGATGADPTGDGSDAPTDGTLRALSESGLLGVVDGVFKVSTEAPNALLLSTDAKARYSAYMFSSSARIATQYQDQGANPRGGVQVVGAVDVWVTNTAVMDVVIDRFQRDVDSFVYNTGWCDKAVFDPMQTDAMAKTADTDDRMILEDWTLVVRNRRTVGTFADIDTTTAMVA